jgi:hypothetical protein
MLQKVIEACNDIVATGSKMYVTNQFSASAIWKVYIYYSLIYYSLIYYSLIYYSLIYYSLIYFILIYS